MDKPHGADTRIHDDSAVCLDQPPFGLTSIRTLFEDDAVTDLMHQGERIRTFLVESTTCVEPGERSLG